MCIDCYDIMILQSCKYKNQLVIFFPSLDRPWSYLGSEEVGGGRRGGLVSAGGIDERQLGPHVPTAKIIDKIFQLRNI